MRTFLICLSMCVAANSGCQRLKSRQSAHSLPTEASKVAASRSTTVPSRPVVSLPGIAERPLRQPPGTSERRPRRGSLTVRVYDTPLDLQLDALTVRGGEFKLEGYGVRYVGQMSLNWRSQIQRPVMLQQRSAALGDSEMELPMIGTVKVVSGQLVIDEIVEVDPARVRGRITFSLPGPEGVTHFAGTFEVDVIAN